MNADAELELLLSLDSVSYEAVVGYVVEFTARRTHKTPERPHGISYALVFRPKNGEPYVRFDNAHAVERPGGKFVKASKAYDHWHRTANDPGRPYTFTTAAQLLDVDGRFQPGHDGPYFLMRARLICDLSPMTNKVAQHLTSPF
jgi:hypothetical protein